MLQLRVEDLVERSRVALDQLEGFSQEEIDISYNNFEL